MEIRKLIGILFLFIVCGSFAQQGLQMDLGEVDSTKSELQRQLEYFQLITGNSLVSGLMDEKIELPKFDINSELIDRFSIPNFNFSSIGYDLSSRPGMINSFYSPFFRNGEVFSAAAYKMGNKFTVGGFSYGANSVFSAPFPNQGIKNFDSYGSTLFMQYNVSKKIKIETRINVSKGNAHPGF